MSKKKIIIIGAGFTGLSAAYDLVKAGFEVEVLESDSEAGGLAGTFEISKGYRVEKFYHHWFASDSHIINWLTELGLQNNIEFLPTNTGLYYANSIFRLASPFDLLKFSPIPFIDRVRTGLMALKARSISDWRSLEGVSAKEWIIRNGGQRAFDVIWQPLLHGKFGVEAENISAVWFWNKLKLRGSSRNKQGGETLAYYKGSFGAAIDSVVDKLRQLGVQFKFSCPVKKINTSSNKICGVDTPHGAMQSDLVLCTVPLPKFSEMINLPDDYARKVKSIRFLGNVCLVLRLKRSLSSTYWLNVADPNFPYVGIIEHTNFDSKANYGNEHLAYLSKYLPITEPMYGMGEEELFNYSLPYIKKIFPDFSKDWVIGYKAWREKYSQPVITKHYSTLIPEHKTPVENLWLSTMAQVYPEDRGTSYAVRAGRDVAKMILNQDRQFLENNSIILDG